MTYQSRIPADDEYLFKLGRAFYNYTYLEAIVVQTIAKVSVNGFESVPKGKPAGAIAKALKEAVDTAEPALPAPLVKSLKDFRTHFATAIRWRNKLLHAHPYTTPDDQQRLMGGDHSWPFEQVDQAAQFFEEAAIEGSDIYHGQLKAARPD